MKKRVLSLLLSLLMISALMPLAITAEAQTGGETLADWNYTLNDEDGTVTLTKYIGTADTVTVPCSFEEQGTAYGTVLASGTVFRANTALKSVTLSEGVRFLNNSMRLLFGECSALTNIDITAVDTSDVVNMSYMFYNCTALKSVDLTQLNMGPVTTIRGLYSGCSALTSADFSAFNTPDVTDMAYLFYDCTALKAVDLSPLDTRSVSTMRAMFSGCKYLSGLTGFENWNTSSLEDMSFMFNNFVYSVNASVRVCLDLSNWDLSNLLNSGWCFQNCRAQQILLPDNLAMISAGFLNHATRYEGSSFTVPAGVKKIGYAHTLYDFATNDLTEIRVAEDNTNYMSVDGVLYSADGKEMLAVPRNKPFENGVFEILEGVDFLGELSFSRNYNIHTVILPDTYEIEYVPIYDDRYIVYNDTGNLNAGTNLSIAIYCYTGITDYAVKSTNPRYASADGIIYSKDMKRVVAVPARYNKPMVIPDGATVWDKEAMWADGSSTVDNLLANCSGVSIPASMKAIAKDQLEMLNRLHKNRAGGSNPFTITLDENCKSFYLDEGGYIVPVNPVPEVSVTDTATVISEPGYDEQSGKYVATVQADMQNADGDYFVYWINENGEIISSYRTYRFYALSDTTLTPVYASQEQYYTERAKAETASRMADIRINDGSVTLYGEHSVSSDKGITGHGIIVTTNAADKDNLNVDNSENNFAARTTANTLTGLLEVTAAIGSGSDTLWARTYIVDGSGEYHYGNVKEYDLDGAGSDSVDEIVMLDSVELAVDQQAEAEETPEEPAAESTLATILNMIIEIVMKIVSFVKSALAIVK